MNLRFSVLSSGSTGNSMVVENEEHRVLIDVGFSAKRMEALLAEREVAAASIDAVMITHEHSDHIKGLGAFARKYNLPVYANEKTWEALNKQIGEIAEENKRVMDTGSVVEFGSLQIESYAISHDAAQPVGYCFHEREQKLSLATDLGYMSSKVKETIADSDVVVLESNHDVNMLRMGKYPWNIKRRILGDEGHLSNESAGEALCDIATSRTKRVYMAHLSRDHNVMELAKLTVTDVLRENGFSCDGKDVKLMDTYFDRSTAWDRLDP